MSGFSFGLWVRILLGRLARAFSLAVTISVSACFYLSLSFAVVRVDTGLEHMPPRFGTHTGTTKVG